jgi:hypothetical protein
MERDCEIEEMMNLKKNEEGTKGGLDVRVEQMAGTQSTKLI